MRSIHLFRVTQKGHSVLFNRRAGMEVAISGRSQKNPGDFLKQALGKAVMVKLNSGVDYRGVLACLDGFMNIAMEQTEEYIDGQLKSRYGDCFIRGNNGCLLFVLYLLPSCYNISFEDSSLYKHDKGKEVKIWKSFETIRFA